MRGRKITKKQRHSNRYWAAVKTLDNGQQTYSPLEAIRKVKQTATAKFDEAVDIAVNLGVDPRKSDQMVRGVVNLPHGTGKKQKVLVFAKGEQADAARAAGADMVGAEDIVEQVQKGWKGWKNFDLIVAGQDMMPIISRIGGVLKARMPNPKSGTVSPNPAKVVEEIKQASRVEYRVDKAGIVHAPIGRASFNEEQLLENMMVLLSALLKAKPSTSKGRYLQKITLSSTMGPSVLVDVQEAQRQAEQVKG
ncbi:MAG: 50S ribosomal protein L1 [Fimbriimonadales bacterium]|nr:MAG: 50S ribosomal protein L1 [Fimbriimonadales bacterium]GIV08879.1 MAG: 50S ribosomal protein L1 [Fimbriimonadales bacterium]GIV11489.1 MAG: 50S ribosomal protein L1 [Fimbriimonadales bacterium]